MNGSLQGNSDFDLSPEQLARLDALGAALFQGQQICVGHQGLVSAKNLNVTQEEKVEKNGQQEGTPRSAAGPREGRQGSPPAGYSDPADFLRRAISDRHQIASLKRSYPSARLHDDPLGHWLAVRVFPLGKPGPEVLLLCMLPKAQSTVRSWAYWYGRGAPHWLGPRHTNYPDGSACVFPPDSNHLECHEPFLRYIDLLSEWCARHLYLAHHQKWPGPQEGRWVDYRLRETKAGECCSKCGGLKEYEHCCKPLDEADAIAGVIEAECPSAAAHRKPPRAIDELARRAGRNPPTVRSVLKTI